MVISITKTAFQRSTSTNNNYMPVKGENQRDIPSRIDEQQAELIQNYFVTGDGRLVTREGLEEVESFSGTPSLLKSLDDDTLVYVYDDGSNSVLKTYTISTDATATINTFTSQNDVTGVKYDKYFYASDGTDRIGCFYLNGKFLDYDNEAVANFTVGETITGGTSGATGVVTALDDDGTAGTLLLTSISGTFQNDEQITGGDSGTTANVDGTAYNWYTLETTTAPACRKLEIYNSYVGAYLLAGDCTDNNGNRVQSQIQWSAADSDTSLIPFNASWATASPPDPDDGGEILYRGGGKLNDFVAHDNQVYAVYDDATTVFHLETINVDLKGLSQTTVTDQQGNNFGGYKMLSTPKGVFYTNENGVNVFTLNGTSDVQAELTNILGEEKIEDINFTDSDLVWDGKNRVYITCKKDSTNNNLVLAYDLNYESWVEITGWNMRRFTRISTGNKNELYGIDVLTEKIYKLFSGYSDDGENIEARIKFKQMVGNPITNKQLENIWMQGVLSPSSEIRVGIHKWDKTNSAIEDAKVYYWCGSDASLTSKYGIGKLPIGKTSQVGEILVSEDFVHRKRPLRNFLKYQIEIISSYQSKHEIHFVQTEITEKLQTRRNNLSTTRCS